MDRCVVCCMHNQNCYVHVSKIMTTQTFGGNYLGMLKFEFCTCAVKKPEEEKCPNIFD